MTAEAAAQAARAVFSGGPITPEGAPADGSQETGNSSQPASWAHGTDAPVEGAATKAAEPVQASPGTPTAEVGALSRAGDLSGAPEADEDVTAPGLELIILEPPGPGAPAPEKSTVARLPMAAAGAALLLFGAAIVALSLYFSSSGTTHHHPMASPPASSAAALKKAPSLTAGTSKAVTPTGQNSAAAQPELAQPKVQTAARHSNPAALARYAVPAQAASAAAINLPVPSEFGPVLRQAWVASNPGGLRLSAADVRSTLQGSVFYASQPSIGSYWAISSFVPSTRAQARSTGSSGSARMAQFAKIAVFYRSAGRDWAYLGASPPGTCPGDVPQPVYSAWGICETALRAPVGS